MNLDLLNNAGAMMLALSLATERFVTVCKTIFPWLAAENTTDGKTDLKLDKMRRLAVHAIAIGGGWITACLVANVGAFDKVSLGGNVKVWAPLLGFLASGGSAAWGNVVNYTKAAKDVKIQQRDGVAQPQVLPVVTTTPPASPIPMTTGMGKRTTMA